MKRTKLPEGQIAFALKQLDNYSRKCLAIEADQVLREEQVVSVMEAFKAHYSKAAERIQVDNGSEFTSKALDRWVYDGNVILDSPDLENPPIIRILNRLKGVSVMNA